MWADFSGLDFTRAQLAVRIAGLAWGDWKPRGIVLHNTAAPTLAQWAESGPNHVARIKNLQHYYEGMGWHGGPHWFVSRTVITEFSNPLRRGTHSPSFNATHFGIEMVGDFSREAFNSGDGALVRDNSVYLMALLCRKFGWDPAAVIVLHKEDKATTHDCPGKNVSKADVISRVKVEMGRQAGGLSPTAPAAPPPSPPAAPSVRRFTAITATVFGGADDPNASAYGGRVDAGLPGVALPFRFRTARPKVVVRNGARAVVADIVDVGPWNIDDDYWNRPDGRPRAEYQHKHAVKDFKGRVPSNDAGIDLTPAAARAIGLVGKGKVDWEFVGALAPAVAKPGAVKPGAAAGGAAVVVGGGAIAAAQAGVPWWAIGIGVVVVLLGLGGVAWWQRAAIKQWWSEL